MRKMQSQLHGCSDRTAGSKDSAGFTLTGAGQKLRETSMDACQEGLPGFDAIDCQFSFDPHGDNRFKEFLKIAAPLRRAVGGSHRCLEFANVFVGLAKVWEAFFKDDVALKLVKLWERG